MQEQSSLTVVFGDPKYTTSQKPDGGISIRPQKVVKGTIDEEGRSKFKAVTKDIVTVPASWEEIPKIPLYRGSPVESESDLNFLVETPLLPAARVLARSDIKTFDSNAHFDDGEQQTYMALSIELDFSNTTLAQRAETLCTHEFTRERWKTAMLPTYDDDGRPIDKKVLCLSWKIDRSVSPQTVARKTLGDALFLTTGKFDYNLFNDTSREQLIRIANRS